MSGQRDIETAVLTVKQAAQRLGQIDPNRVRALCLTHELESFQLVPKGRWYIVRQSVDDWIDAQARKYALAHPVDTQASELNEVVAGGR